ncbi:MAG TPA: RodZ domain-containing protein [Actinomycetota bacterium]
MTIGVGHALKKVRESRDLELEEAARDTRIRSEFLQAIEADDFDRLLGDVHTRGCLRTYASYLRLSPEKVIAAYESSMPARSVEAAGAQGLAPPEMPTLGRRRLRDNHRLLGMIAATILVLAAAFGVLSARQPAPAPAEPETEAPAAAVDPELSITVTITAREPVDVTIVADGGEPDRYRLEAGEGRSFDGKGSIKVWLSSGGVARVTVNGRDLGFPGVKGRPWEDTFAFGTPSP